MAIKAIFCKISFKREGLELYLKNTWLYTLLGWLDVAAALPPHSLSLFQSQSLPWRTSTSYLDFTLQTHDKHISTNSFACFMSRVGVFPLFYNYLPKSEVMYVVNMSWEKQMTMLNGSHFLFLHRHWFILAKINLFHKWVNYFFKVYKCDIVYDIKQTVSESNPTR